MLLAGFSKGDSSPAGDDPELARVREREAKRGVHFYQRRDFASACPQEHGRPRVWGESSRRPAGLWPARRSRRRWIRIRAACSNAAGGAVSRERSPPKCTTLAPFCPSEARRLQLSHGKRRTADSGNGTPARLAGTLGLSPRARKRPTPGRAHLRIRQRTARAPGPCCSQLPCRLRAGRTRPVRRLERPPLRRFRWFGDAAPARPPTYLHGRPGRSLGRVRWPSCIASTTGVTNAGRCRPRAWLPCC